MTQATKPVLAGRTVTSLSTPKSWACWSANTPGRRRLPGD